MSLYNLINDENFVDTLFNAEVGSDFNKKLLIFITQAQAGLSGAYSELKSTIINDEAISVETTQLLLIEIERIFANLYSFAGDSYEKKNSFELFTQFSKQTKDIISELNQLSDRLNIAVLKTVPAKHLGYVDNHDSLYVDLEAVTDKFEHVYKKLALQIKGISFSGQSISNNDAVNIQALANLINQYQGDLEHDEAILVSFSHILIQMNNSKAKQELLKHFIYFCDISGDEVKVPNREIINEIFLDQLKKQYTNLFEGINLNRKNKNTWLDLLAKLPKLEGVSEILEWLEDLEKFRNNLGREKHKFHQYKTIYTHLEELEGNLYSWLTNNNSSTLKYIKHVDETDEKIQQMLMLKQLKVIDQQFSSKQQAYTARDNSFLFRTKENINRLITVFQPFEVRRFKNDTELMTNIMTQKNDLYETLINADKVNSVAAQKFSDLIKTIESNGKRRQDNRKHGKDRQVAQQLKTTLYVINKISSTSPQLQKANTGMMNNQFANELAKYLKLRTSSNKGKWYKPNFGGIKNSIRDIVHIGKKRRREEIVANLSHKIQSCQSVDDYMRYVLTAMSEVDSIKNANSKLTDIILKQIYTLIRDKILAEGNTSQLLTIYRVLGNRYQNLKSFKNLHASIKEKIKEDNQIDNRLLAELSINETDSNKIVKFYADKDGEIEMDKKAYLLFEKFNAANSGEDYIKFIVNAVLALESDTVKSNVMRGELIKQISIAINNSLDNLTADELYGLGQVVSQLTKQHKQLTQSYIKIKAKIKDLTNAKDRDIINKCGNDVERQAFVVKHQYQDENNNENRHQQFLSQFEYKVYALLSTKLAAFRLAPAGVFRTNTGDFQKHAGNAVNLAAQGLGMAGMPGAGTLGSILSFVVSEIDGNQQKNRFKNISELLESDAMIAALSRNIAENLTKIWEYQIVKLGHGLEENVDTFAACAVERIIDYLAKGAYRNFPDLPLELQLCAAVRTQHISHSPGGTRVASEGVNSPFSDKAFVIEDIFEKTPVITEDGILGNLGYASNIGAARDGNQIAEMLNMHPANDFEDEAYQAYGYICQDGPEFKLDPMVSKKQVLEMLHREERRINDVERRMERVEARVDENANGIAVNQAEIIELKEQKQALEARIARLEIMAHDIQGRKVENRYSFYSHVRPDVDYGLQEKQILDWRRSIAVNCS